MVVKSECIVYNYPETVFQKERRIGLNVDIVCEVLADEAVDWKKEGQEECKRNVEQSERSLRNYGIAWEED